MSREDLDPRVTEAFIEHDQDGFMEYLYKIFADSERMREAYCTHRHIQYLQFKEKYDEDYQEALKEKNYAQD